MMDIGIENLTWLARQFHNFDDGLLMAIALDFGDRSQKPRVSVELIARDNSLEEVKWARLRNKVIDLTEFRMEKMRRADIRVLSCGVSTGFFDGLVFIDFSSPDPESIEDYRRSECYVAGKGVEAEVISYLPSP